MQKTNPTVSHARFAAPSQPRCRTGGSVPQNLFGTCALPAPWRGRGVARTRATERGDSDSDTATSVVLPRPAGFQPGKPSRPCRSCRAHGAHPAGLRRRRIPGRTSCNAILPCPAPRPLCQLPQQDGRAVGTPSPPSTPSRTRGELGQLRCYQMCCEAGMWCGHIWRVCTASCCAAGAGKDQLCWAENPSPAGGGCAGSAWLCLFNTQTHPQLCLPSAAGTPSKGQPCHCGHTHSSRSLDAVPGGASPPR